MADESKLERIDALKEAFFNERDDSKLAEMFALLDKNGNGSIEASELRSFFPTEGRFAMPQEDMDQFIQAADTNKNGSIDLTEFSDFFKKARG